MAEWKNIQRGNLTPEQYAEEVAKLKKAQKEFWDKYGEGSFPTEALSRGDFRDPAIAKAIQNWAKDTGQYVEEGSWTQTDEGNVFNAEESFPWTGPDYAPIYGQGFGGVEAGNMGGGGFPLMSVNPDALNESGQQQLFAPWTGEKEERWTQKLGLPLMMALTAGFTGMGLWGAGAFAGAGAAGSGAEMAGFGSTMGTSSGASGLGAGAASAGAGASAGLSTGGMYADAVFGSAASAGLTAEKAGLIMKAAGLGISTISSLMSGTASPPEFEQAQNALSSMNDPTAQALADMLKSQTALSDTLNNQSNQYYQNMIDAGTLTPDEEADFENEYNLQLQALNEQFARETQAAGGKQMASLVARGMFDTSVGSREIAKTQEDYAGILGEQTANLLTAKETAKTNLTQARQQLAQSGYQMTSSMAQNQMQTALQASMALQNYYANQGATTANTSLQNALYNQAVQRNEYNQRMSLLSGVTGLGLGLLRA